MATKTKWVMVRVKVQTHQRLTDYCNRLDTAYHAGQVTLPDHQADGVSFNFAVERLLDQNAGHRRRARKVRQKRKNGPDGPEAA
jgi:hypothetical protein